jgi:D-lactate dehydrogenase
MVGSEGTLGFIIAATFRTVPVYPHAATALLVFDEISHATDALPALIDAGARTAELMDAASLRVAQAGAKVVPAAGRTGRRAAHGAARGAAGGAAPTRSRSA